MLRIIATEAWKATHPGAKIGLLEISGVDNSQLAPELNQAKYTLEQRLREKYAGFSRKNFLEMPVMQAYHRYYRRLGYTSHVLLQLESIALKGKSLPDVSPLVDANFAAELDTLILTAGHDVARLEEPIVIDVARAGDEMIQMGGNRKEVPAGDMLMKDANGIACSILRGQDNRSPISKATTHVLYVSYVPDGVVQAQVRAHMDAVENNVRLFAIDCKVEQSVILFAKH